MHCYVRIITFRLSKVVAEKKHKNRLWNFSFNIIESTIWCCLYQSHNLAMIRLTSLAVKPSGRYFALGSLFYYLTTTSTSGDLSSKLLWSVLFFARTRVSRRTIDGWWLVMFVYVSSSFLLQRVLIVYSKRSRKLRHVCSSISIIKSIDRDRSRRRGEWLKNPRS